MRNTILIILILILIICFLLFINCKPLKEKFSEITALSVYKNPLQNSDPNNRFPPWFHGLIDTEDNNTMYKYNYSYSKFNERDTKNFLIAFVCVKSIGILESMWTAEHDNILEMIRNKAPCKTGIVYDLRSEAMKRKKDRPEYAKNFPSNNKLIQEIMEDEINQTMSGYKDISGGKIFAPVYCIMIQYPNKIYTYSDGQEAVKYSHFDLEEKDLVPFQRKDVRNLDSPNVDDNEGLVDTKILFLYPMYHKTKNMFYRPLQKCDKDNNCEDFKFTFEKENCIDTPNTLECLDQYPEYRLNIKNFKPNIKNGTPTIQGIVDMIKFLSGSQNNKPNNNLKLKVTKAQQCFIKCNNDTSKVCGCGTKLYSDEYKSYCKDRYNEDNPETKNQLSNYAFVYRVNELKSDINTLSDIEIDSGTEERISLLINYEIDKLPYSSYPDNAIPTPQQIREKLQI